MFEKTLEFAAAGKGRRLINTLSRKDTGLTREQLEQVLALYRDQGLLVEVESLKKRRGILTDAQYDALAQKVAQSCCAQTVDDFLICLRDLLSCGIKMNPTKMDEENLR